MQIEKIGSNSIAKQSNDPFNLSKNKFNISSNELLKPTHKRHTQYIINKTTHKNVHNYMYSFNENQISISFFITEISQF